MALSERSYKILMAIVEEFMNGRDEVGSVSLARKYDLNASPATIRNEMVKLMNEGYLVKSHISSGRIPTDQAIRLYIRDHVENILDVIQSIQLNQSLFEARFDKDQLVKRVLRELSVFSKSVAFSATKNELQFYGLSILMEQRDFADVERVKGVVDLLENEELFFNLLSKYASDDITVLVGYEIDVNDLYHSAIVFTRVPFWNSEERLVGVLGSKRMDYANVISGLRVIRDTLDRSLRGWI